MLVEQRAHAAHRVERRHRLLRNEADFAPEHDAALGRRDAQHVADGELQRAFGDGKAGRQDAADEAPHHRFAGAGFADEAEDAARPKREVEIAQHGDARAADRRRDRDRFRFEQRRHWMTRWRSFGSSARRSPSPSRLKPSTVMMMALIGKIMPHTAWNISRRPSAIMTPHAGTFASTLMPTKDRIASTMTAMP